MLDPVKIELILALLNNYSKLRIESSEDGGILIINLTPDEIQFIQEQLSKETN